MKLPSLWHLILIAVTLGFIAGSLFGYGMGMISTENRITNMINQIANQDINLLKGNNGNVYEITLVNGTCQYTGEDSYSCTITNQRTGQTITKWIPK
jgi:hypothetical protein